MRTGSKAALESHRDIRHASLIEERRKRSGDVLPAGGTQRVQKVACRSGPESILLHIALYALAEIFRAHPGFKHTNSQVDDEELGERILTAWRIVSGKVPSKPTAHPEGTPRRQRVCSCLP